MKKPVYSIIALVLLVGTFYLGQEVKDSNTPSPSVTQVERYESLETSVQPTSEPDPNVETSNKVKISFPTDRYPETSRHIQNAIERGRSPVCTIDRSGAEKNREESLKGVPTKKGYDRDEWPMAMCAEGGTGADIEYITPKDNRGAGSWVGNKLEHYSDGTKIEFVF
ncbi:Sporulation-specific extracellular nuclease precursor [compost metagenome]